ncbi:MAG: hypothetical protein AAF827_16570, partial [Cyanobacteria bacterium P01_D01_bin.6]
MTLAIAAAEQVQLTRLWVLGNVPGGYCQKPPTQRPSSTQIKPKVALPNQYDYFDNTVETRFHG